ncbi:MAG: RNA-binding cell elongation regulator Jag/EloR [Candidatus Binatia bacterium]
MDSVEAAGNSIDEAIGKALELLGTTRERVDIEIMSNAVRGLCGFGGRKARVRATVRRPLSTEPATAAPAAEALAGNRRVAERGREILETIIKHMRVDARVAVRDVAAQPCVLELAGDASGVLIGRRGQMLDALEYIVNRIIARDEGGAARVVIDSQNYRARRRETLEDLARRMAEQAKKRGKPVTLNPLSPRDRRIVHMILQQDTSLSTKSTGSGFFRKLIIVPAGRKPPPRGHDRA